jgi:hypothetical protein
MDINCDESKRDYAIAKLEGYNARIENMGPLGCPYGGGGSYSEIMGENWLEGWTVANDLKFSQVVDAMRHWGKLVDECMKIFAEAAMWDDYEKIKAKIESGPGWNQ